MLSKIVLLGKWYNYTILDWK